MDFTEAVQWWGHWELRILVLGSLSLQYFLFITARLRKRRIHPLLRFSIWLACLGSDAVATYALATILSHQQKRQWVFKASNNASLEVLWAPVMLLHLGGRDIITAFSIEDNELWKRHALTTASRIAVAIYVFYKSGKSGDVRLFQATILFFVPGILKCLEKPWAFYKASIYSLAKADLKLQEDPKMNSNRSLQSYVEEARKYLHGDLEDGGIDIHVIENPSRLFVDLSYSYDVPLQNLKYMAGKRDQLNGELYARLFIAFESFYTKCNVFRYTLLGHVVRIASLFLTFATTALFHTSRKDAYSDTDVSITYVLLCCAASLEFFSVCRKIQYWRKNHKRLVRRAWPDDVAQYNLIWYLARRMKQPRWLAFPEGCHYCLDQHRCMEPCRGEGITKRIHDHITKGWKYAITGQRSYREFNDYRGQHTLSTYLPKNHEDHKRKQSPPPDENHHRLKWSIQRPFDESVILWHLATDFCFYKKNTSSTFEDASLSRKISNYMAYLLFVRPELLMPGARPELFTAAYRELRYKLLGNKALRPGEGTSGGLAKKILSNMDKCKKEETPFLFEARELAKGLMRLESEETMWKVIEGVWVEMLCFSASRCRGFLHAESLGRGGEYLSCVWLLMWYMGMETFSARQQRTNLVEKGDMSTAVPEMDLGG